LDSSSFSRKEEMKIEKTRVHGFCLSASAYNLKFNDVPVMLHSFQFLKIATEARLDNCSVSVAGSLSVAYEYSSC